MRGEKKAKEIIEKMNELNKEFYHIHQECYNAGVAEEVSDMYYDAYARINRTLTDLTDIFRFKKDGSHYCGYGITHGLDEETLRPLELKNL